MIDILTYEYSQRIKAKKFFVIHIKQLGGKGVWCRSGTTDPDVLRTTFFNQYELPPLPLPEYCTILDLGSNVGYTIAHLKHAYPHARIVGVEMDKENFEVCKKNTESYEGCELLNAAVWTSDGLVEYGGQDEQSYAVSSTGTYQKIQSITIPTLIEQYGIEKIDYLKMDIEGAEIPIFKENLDWLRIVMSAKIEVHFAKDAERQETMPSFIDMLSKHGFSAREDSHHWSTVIAVRNT
ncbi:MAG: FkbM family methyltransferase [Minisyncoccia bacterium]